MNHLKLRRVRLVTVDAQPYTSSATVITGPEDVAKVARAILPTDREGFVVLHLDARSTVRSVELVSIGSLNATIIHPREVFKAAILANAAAIVISHNHPSGDPKPSEEDLTITRRLHEAGRILGIELMDHVIVGATDFYSLREHRKI